MSSTLSLRYVYIAILEIKYVLQGAHLYNDYLRIECILLKFHWGMKALIELHFQ